MDIEIIKASIKSHLKILKWDPTEEQIREIYKKFISLEEKQQTITSLAKIVGSVYGKYTTMCMDSIDNSDIKAIIKLATEKAKPNTAPEKK